MRPIRVPPMADVWDTWERTHAEGVTIPHYRILLNGEPLRKCIGFDEAAGTAEVFVTDDNGKTILFREDDPPGPRTRSVTGTIRLESDPETRAWFEEQFGRNKEAL